MFSRKQQLKSHSDCAHGLAVTVQSESIKFAAKNLQPEMASPFPVKNLQPEVVVQFPVSIDLDDESHVEGEPYFVVEETATEDQLEVGDIILA
jgi:hypothetical protein